MKKKCCIYTRVSTAAQTEGYSLEAQQERLHRFSITGASTGRRLTKNISAILNLP